LKKSKFSTYLICIMLGAALVGCAGGKRENYDESTLSIDKKGRVSERTVASFAKDYYDIAELEGEFNTAISEYNTSSGRDNSIELKDIQLKNQNVYVTVDFASTNDYEQLQKETLFLGTINEAYDSGYTMDVTLKGTVEGNKIGKVEIMGMTDKHIIIMSEPIKIKTYQDIIYVSANVEVLGEREARVVNESGGLAYLILAK